ncbi:MAG: GntR family transcriptional regulator [Alphaproteobacteria bacterium]|nr:GntR family transcriptional regulator [Alphaproteobacteria bacterium]
MRTAALTTHSTRSPARLRRALGRLDSRLPTPLYHQIYVLLREQILGGIYVDNDLVPTEQELTQRFGVSRITAKRALDELASEGLVVRRRGKGTTVASRVAVPAVSANISGLIENLLMMGLKTKVEIVDFAYVPAAEEVARALDMAVGAEVQRAVRVRALDGVPLSYTISHVPAALGRTYGRKDLTAKPLLELLERAGVLIGSADQSIGAVLADTIVAPRLGVRIGAPLLSVTRTVFDQHGRPVEYITILYRPDRYRYRMKLARVQGSATKLWSATD